MADYSFLRKVAVRELDQAVARTAVLAGALARVVADQQRRLDALEGKVTQKKAS